MTEQTLPPPSGKSVTRPDGATTPPGGAKRAPNYAARRMVVSAIVITAVAAVGVGVWQLAGGDPAVPTGGVGDWDEIALVDRATGAIVVVDGEGQVVSEQEGLGRVTDIHVDGNRLALVGPSQIVLTSADDTEPVTVETGRQDEVARLDAETFTLGVGPPTGGNVLIVDVGSGDVLDVGALTEQPSPRMFPATIRSDGQGRRFAVADAVNFQTILVETGATEPVYFADIPVAVGDDRVATSQVIGRSADVGIFDDDREMLAMVQTGLPIVGWFDGDDLLIVTSDGAISRIRGGATSAEPIGRITVPGGATILGVTPMRDRDRLVVIGDIFQSVVTIEGDTIFTASFTQPTTVEAPDPRWTCLPMGGGDAYLSLVAIDSGAQLADLTGLEVTGTSLDGCTVVGVRNGVTEVVADGAIGQLGRVRSAALAPDGRSVVVQSTSGATELVRLDDALQPDGDAIDLGQLAPSSLAVAYLDR